MKTNGSASTWILVIGVIAVGVFGVYKLTQNSSSIRPEPAPLVPTEEQKGEPITISGEVVCLPHKDNGSGAQTQECALGILGTDGKYYGLLDSTPDYAHIGGLGGGERISIAGVFRREQKENQYKSIGVIEINTLEKIPENNKL